MEEIFALEEKLAKLESGEIGLNAWARMENEPLRKAEIQRLKNEIQRREYILACTSSGSPYDADEYSA